MATYILVNKHAAAECEPLNEDAVANPFAARLKGTPFLCTCPSGDHGGIFALEADSEDEALALVSPKFRAGTSVYGGEVFTIGNEIPVA